jgi:hypothetical protein
LDDPSLAVRAFIDAYIESIDYLRILLVLARDPQREWTSTQVAHAVKQDLTATAAILERMCATGLAARPEGAADTFRYSPRAAEFHQMVQELIALDERRPVTLIRMVYARGSSTAQAFADAFRLRGG